jgi:hypothetical protein
MRRKMPSATTVLCALVIASGGAACSERGQMYSDQSNSSTPSTTRSQNDPIGQNNSTAENRDAASANNRTSISVTGCVQQASGMSNYVLTNLRGSEGSPEQRARGYRIESGDKVKQHVGKQVRVTGWVDSQDTGSSQGQAGQSQSGQSQSSSSSQNGSSSQMSYTDLQQLHVENVEPVSNNCGNSSGSSSNK